jgi:hypothetical protein
MIADCGLLTTVADQIGTVRERQQAPFDVCESAC